MQTVHYMANMDRPPRADSFGLTSGPGAGRGPEPPPVGPARRDPSHPAAVPGEHTSGQADGPVVDDDLGPGTEPGPGR